MKIKFAPYQPHCFAFGGFELQMLSALGAIQKCGGQASKLDPWDRDDDFNILHCWGLGLPHQENIHWAKKSGKKVVITGLLPYVESLSEKVRHLISSYIRVNYFLQQMSRQADGFTVLNDLQAEICHRYYKVPSNKIHIVPNIVDDNFFSAHASGASKAIFPTKYGLTDYVLTTGNVCSRKNQLNLMHACIRHEINLVMIGKPLMGEERYIEEVNKLVENHKNILWIRGLPENSPELISAYMNSSLFALPSYVESQPICLLEAAVMGKPLLIANRAYARQSFYENACLVDPSSISAIGKGLKESMENPAQHVPDFNEVRVCNAKTVGEKYLSVYNASMHSLNG